MGEKGYDASGLLFILPGSEGIQPWKDPDTASLGTERAIFSNTLK